MAQIHPTALVDPAAELAEDVRVGPYCVIGAGVTLEKGTRIGPGSVIGADDLQDEIGRASVNVVLGEKVVVGAHCRIVGTIGIGSEARILDGCRIRGTVAIGARTELYDGVVIGNPGQFPGRHARDGIIEIGPDCVLREGTTVTQPVLTDRTVVGTGSYLMARTQVDHDCVVGRSVKTATGVTLGGSVTIGDYAYLGMNAAVHQRVVVGAHAMIAMNGAVLQHVPPYAVLIRQRFTKINRRGLQARGCDEAVAHAIHAFFARGERSPPDGSIPDAWAGPIRDFFAQIGHEPYTRLVAG
jgi:UDP-N-acetylglucosamine acyltransferase